MTSTQQTNTTHWGKAIVFSLLFLLILFFLFSRSSCSRNFDAAKNANARSETVSNDSNGTVEEEPAPTESPSGEDATANESSEKVEAGEETKSAPEETLSDPQGETLPPPEKSDTAMPTTGKSTEGGPPASTDSGETAGQSIGGLSVRGERLGVILDVSGSMHRYLDSLRKEIRAGFADAEFREVEGCFLEPVDTSAIPDPSTVSRDSVMDAIAELVRNHQVDSIYWFCDLQDERTEDAVRQLRTLALGQAGNQKAFRLYIRSTDELPDPALEEIIRSSGGAFERSRRSN